MQQARESLISASPINKSSLERIESAIVIICLDDKEPITREDISWQCWVGDGRNRFYDKHQCKNSTTRNEVSLIICSLVIVFDNGRSGFLGEHSCMVTLVLVL